jgi:hypothetical protein
MTTFDRTSQDVGNILLLEHLNLTVPDLSLAALFYVSGLGFTRDPYMDFGLRNLWINAGEQQFHLPSGEPQRFRGAIGIVVPDRERLHERLARIAAPLRATAFTWQIDTETTGVTCPWGNRFVVHQGSPDGPMDLGLAYLDMQVPTGTAAGIARFYRTVLGAPATAGDGRATVQIGTDQVLYFTERAAALPDYDGHHIAIYIADFSGPHRALESHGFISEESDAHQYRFQRLFDPDTGAPLVELEHEVRSLRHPMYQRSLINRNAAVDLRRFRKGHEQYHRQ